MYCYFFLLRSFLHVPLPLAWCLFVCLLAFFTTLFLSASWQRPTGLNPCLCKMVGWRGQRFSVSVCLCLSVSVSVCLHVCLFLFLSLSFSLSLSLSLSLSSSLCTCLCRLLGETDSRDNLTAHLHLFENRLWALEGVATCQLQPPLNYLYNWWCATSPCPHPFHTTSLYFDNPKVTQGSNFTEAPGAYGQGQIGGFSYCQRSISSLCQPRLRSNSSAAFSKSLRVRVAVLRVPPAMHLCVATQRGSEQISFQLDNWITRHVDAVANHHLSVTP